MIRDLLRTACVIAAMAVAASLVVETRLQLATIDLAHRQAASWQAGQGGYASAQPPAAPEPPSRLARLGRATLGLADAALGVVR